MINNLWQFCDDKEIFNTDNCQHYVFIFKEKYPGF